MATGDEILAMKKAAEAQVPRRVTNCPICDWPLEEHPDTGVLNCPLGHWRSGTGARNE